MASKPLLEFSRASKVANVFSVFILEGDLLSKGWKQFRTILPELLVVYRPPSGGLNPPVEKAKSSLLGSQPLALIFPMFQFLIVSWGLEKLLFTTTGLAK